MGLGVPPDRVEDARPASAARRGCTRRRRQTGRVALSHSSLAEASRARSPRRLRGIARPRRRSSRRACRGAKAQSAPSVVGGQRVGDARDGPRRTPSPGACSQPCSAVSAPSSPSASASKPRRGRPAGERDGAVERRGVGPLRRQHGAHVGVGERPQRDLVAARLDGRQQPAGPMRDQQEQRLGRRLFEDLEQRVGGRRIAVVDRVDDGDADARPGRGSCAISSMQLAHFLDPDDGVEALAGLARLPAQHEEVRDSAPAATCSATCCGALVAGARRRLSRAMSNASVALPMPRGPCSRMPPGSRAGVERGQHVGARGRRGRRPRVRLLGQRHAVELVGLARSVVVAHAGCSRCSSGKRRLSDVPDFLLERIFALVGGDHDAALGIVAGDGEEGIAQPPVPVEVFLLEAVAGAASAASSLALADAAEGGLGSMSRTMVRSGLWPLSASTSSAADQLVVDAAGQALIGAGRIRGSGRRSPSCRRRDWARSAG